MPFLLWKIRYTALSTNETDHVDRDILRQICSLRHQGRPIDGYYMARQESVLGKFDSFHSEIGLCRHAFRKITLLEHKKIVNPRQVVRQVKSIRARNNSNSNNNNNHKSRSSVSRRLLASAQKSTRNRNRNRNSNSNSNRYESPRRPQRSILSNFQTP